MKPLFALAACLALVFVAGCDTDVGEKVGSVLSAREEPRVREFQGDSKAVYAAARAAADEMGYRFVRGGPAEGKMEALSGISGGEDTGSSRQVKMKVRIEPTGDSTCEVSVSFGEIIEDNSLNAPGMATETPLKDTPLYEVFFRNVDKALKAPPGH
jgi:hypothetical protein